MLEHECESDEDCEVYFLKPVNEYNIVDRIKLANKELFAETETKVNEDENGGDNGDSTISRKVTFAVNLENYEPFTENTFKQVSVEESERENGGKEEKEADELQRRLSKDFKFPVIDEEESNQNLDEDEEEPEEEVEEDIQNNMRQNMMTSNNSMEPTDKIIKSVCQEKMLRKKDDNDHVEIEEIVEEIICMDTDGNNRTTTPALEDLNLSETLTHCRIMKQETFDFDGAESDNKSLTNLLISSDGENNEDDVDEKLSNETYRIEYDDENSNSNNNENYYDFDDDDDDDDNLSLIVASYLTNDFENISLNHSDRGSKKNNQIFPAGRKKFIKSGRILPFNNKRFSFRKTKSNNSCPDYSPPPEVTDLKFNYKICCEYRRHLEQPEKLPKYTGYLSEYGLSREQIELRAKKLQHKKRFAIEESLKANQVETRKMQDNERAFTTWLKNKIRYPINKTRNMFDIKKTRNIFNGKGTARSSGASAKRNRTGSGGCNGNTIK